MSLLEVKNLSVDLSTLHGTVHAVRDISFCIEKGDTVALVGESGCGKSMTCMAIMGLMDKKKVAFGNNMQILFNQTRIDCLSEKEMRKIRGAEIGMIFQDPVKSLNPTERIGEQISDVILAHENCSKKEAMIRAEELLHKVGIREPQRRLRQFPHELSGGMRQRVVIAMAVACHPRLLIADEPTTALDATVQAEILELIKSFQKEYEMSVLLVTHNLGVVSAVADQIMVMYGGKIVETGSKEQIFYHPKHPYTQALLDTIPNPEERKTHMHAIPGSPPNLIYPPTGCPFLARCKERMNICALHSPDAYVKEGQTCFCYLYDKRCQKLTGKQEIRS